MNYRTTLSMWTIYDHPADFPDHFVAREWVIGSDGRRAMDVVMVDTSLDSLRTTMQNMALHCLPREAGDDPVIVETWI